MSGISSIRTPRMKHFNGATIGKRAAKIDGPALDRKVSLFRLHFSLNKDDSPALFHGSPQQIYGYGGSLFKKSLDVNNWPYVETMGKMMNDANKFDIVWEKEWLM